MKDFADDNLKFEENERKLFKPVENTVGKGEIARYEQFLLFPHCFQKACFPGASKGVIVWEWVKRRDALLAEQLLSLQESIDVPVNRSKQLCKTHHFSLISAGVEHFTEIFGLSMFLGGQLLENIVEIYLSAIEICYRNRV